MKDAFCRSKFLTAEKPRIFLFVFVACLSVALVSRRVLCCSVLCVLVGRALLCSAVFGSLWHRRADGRRAARVQRAARLSARCPPTAPTHALGSLPLPCARNSPRLRAWISAPQAQTQHTQTHTNQQTLHTATAADAACHVSAGLRQGAARAHSHFGRG